MKQIGFEHQTWQAMAKSLADTFGLSAVLFTQMNEGQEKIVSQYLRESAEFSQGGVLTNNDPFNNCWLDKTGYAITFQDEKTQVMGFKAMFSIPIFSRGKLYGFIKLLDNQESRLKKAVPLATSIRNIMESHLDLANQLNSGKIAEKELEKKQNYLQTIFDAAPVSMMLINDKLNTVAINDTIKKLVDAEPSQFINRQPGDGLGCAIALGNPSGCGHSLECKFCQIRNTIKKVFKTKKPVHHVDANACLVIGGKVVRVWIELSGVPLQLEGRDHVVISLNNITDRKKAELKRKESELRLKKAEQIANLGNWVMNFPDKKLVWSDQVFRIFGEEPQSFQPTFDSLLSFVHPADKDGLTEAYNTSVKERTGYEYQHRIKRADGTCRYVEERGTHEFDEFGNAVRTAGTVLDITEQKKIQEELQEANGAKDKFFSIIAHDLKSPFNNLLGLFDIIEMPNIDEESKQEVLVHMKKMVVHGKSLLEDLLEWARAQTGRVGFTPEQFSTRSLINDCIQLSQQSARTKEITLKTTIPAGTHTVIVDKHMVDTVLRNLVNNAIKFTPRGGDVIVGHYANEEGHEVFFVKDTGIGISPVGLKKIFALDQNYSTKGTDNEGGTGIGLLLCKEFVEKNGGEIWVESTLKEGSTFYFSAKQAGGPSVTTHIKAEAVS